MRKALTKIFSINFITSILNFLTTILVVKLFGLGIFGEFVVVSSYVGFLTLLYIIIPPSYAVFKTQDDKIFKDILFFNYLLSSVLIVLFVFIFQLFIKIDINMWLFILFAIFTGVLNLFDVYLKAINKLSQYFMILFSVSVVKIILIVIIYIFNLSITLDSLIMINTIPLFFAILYGSFIIRLKIKFNHFNKYMIFLTVNFKTIKNYYLNIFIKRVKDSGTILVLSLIFSHEIIGLYSLFTKVSMFILGQARVIEAYFMNRQNLENISKIEAKKWLISFVLQLLIVIVGVVYVKFAVDKFYIQELLIYSFISYPYINLIFIRNKLMSEYKVNLLNYMYLIYIAFISLFFIISKFIIVDFQYLIIFILFVEIISNLFIYYIRKRSTVSV